MAFDAVRDILINLSHFHCTLTYPIVQCAIEMLKCPRLIFNALETKQIFIICSISI